MIPSLQEIVQGTPSLVVQAKTPSVFPPLGFVTVKWIVPAVKTRKTTSANTLPAPNICSDVRRENVYSNLGYVFFLLKHVMSTMLLYFLIKTKTLYFY